MTEEMVCTHTHTHRQPLCLDRWRGSRGAGREGRLVLIAVNQAVRREDRRGRRIAVNSDPLPGRRAANVSERERVNNLERRAELQQAQGERGEKLKRDGLR